MTAEKQTLTGASSTGSWKDLPWKVINKHVNRLQVRIAKAKRDGKSGKVKALQRLLTHSFYSKCTAIKRVVTNKGAKTPGCDGLLWKTPAQKMKAVHSLKRRSYKPKSLRRIYIPKNNDIKNLRPLSIPTMKDRAMHALYLLALEPITEEIADHNSYGFRPERCTMDAIEQCHKLFSKKSSSKWVLEGDIRACFDSIGKSWLLENVPMDKVILGKFMEAGFIEKGTWYPTLRGSPQGSPLSPTLAVIALSGLEKRLKENFKRSDKVHAVIYADDFIVSGESKELLETQVKPVIAQFLMERGLELSESKTKVTHINEGFDFLGFNLRKYPNGKLLTKPSKANVKRFLGNIRGLIKANVALETDKLIHLLNPKIRGWANYYRHGVSSRTFVKVDHEIYLALVRWMRRRHARKGQSWMNSKYFRQKGLRRWIFHAKIIKDGQIRFLDLANARSIHIRRFPKIVGAAHPFNPEYWEYFSKRTRMKRSLLHLRTDVVLYGKPDGQRPSYKGLSGVR